MKASVVLLFSMLAFAVPSLADVTGCSAAPSDKRWMRSMLDSWTKVAAKDLNASPAIPWIVFFDGRCVHHVNPDPRTIIGIAGRSSIESRIPSVQGAFALVSAEHGGEVALPDGQRIPPQLITFATAWGDGERPYFVMAMPQIWRGHERHASNPKLDDAIRAVMVHEMTHTLQLDAFSERLGSFEREHPGIELDDDIVQTVFESNERVSELWSEERDLLYAAAAASTDAEAGQLVRRALEVMESRRALIVAENPAVASVEDVFLLMEGVANWAGVQSLIHGGETRDSAVDLMRGRRHRWSQDEGLAIFLVLDRFEDGWQSEVLSDPSLSIGTLLEDAITK